MTGQHAAPGWAPTIAADANNDRWVATDGHHAFLWSDEVFEREIDLPGVPGQGAATFLSDGALLVGRYRIGADFAVAEQLPLTALAEVYDPAADESRIAVRTAWSADGQHALVGVTLPPTRLRGDKDTVRPGSMLAWVTVAGSGANPPEVRALAKGRFLSVDHVAADTWLCTGSEDVRVIDPGTGEMTARSTLDSTVTAIATVGDTVAVAVAAGDVVILHAISGSTRKWHALDAVVDALALSPDGELVACGDRAGHLKVQRVGSGETVFETTVAGRIDGMSFFGSVRVIVAVGGTQRRILHLDVAADVPHDGS